MKAQELRIGNYVEGIGMEHPIRKIYDSIQYNYKRERYELDDIDILYFKPITLTEEWLLKFGFTSNPYEDRYEKGLLHIECNKTRGILEFWIERLPLSLTIKHVHQLQNLYFALIGEELTIKQD
jgi:hypothetical protein